MKSLRPITILAVGPPLVGVAVSAVAAIAGHDACTVRSSLISFVMGLVLGALILTPIAAVEAFRARLAYLLGAYAFRIQWYVSLTMAFAMGYALASMRQGGFDGFVGLAFAAVFIGAMIKMAMGILYEPGEGSAAAAPQTEDTDADETRCSFCSKAHSEVQPFAEGPGNVYICYPCIRLCADIIDQECQRRGIPLKEYHA